MKIDHDVKQMQESVDKMEAELNAMKAQLKKMEIQNSYQNNSEWGFNTDSMGYGITSKDEVYEVMPTRLHKENIDRVNKLFKTKEKADEIRFQQALWRKLQRFADEHNYPMADKSDGYAIFYEKRSHKITPMAVNSDYTGINIVIFSSKEICQNALNTFYWDLEEYYKMVLTK